MKYFILLLVSTLLIGCGGGGGDSSSQPVPPSNTRPIANAGDDIIGEVGSEIALSGSLSSDADGDTLTYEWRIISAPSESTLDTSPSSIVSSINVTFTPDVVGQYQIQLIVNDGTVNSLTDTITIVVERSNSPPSLSVTGENWVLETFQLDTFISASDVDGDNLSFSVTGSDSSFFFISDGELLVNVALDYETPSDENSDNIYDLIINVSDGIETTSQSFQLEVKNINELPESLSIRKHSAGDFLKHIAVYGTEIGSFTESYTENNEDIDAFAGTDFVKLYKNWTFNGESILQFKVAQSQSSDDIYGPLIEYGHVDFEDNSYCSNYQNDSCVGMTILPSVYTDGVSSLTNFYSYYLDSVFTSTRESYSTNGFDSFIVSGTEFVYLTAGINEAFEVIVLDVERIFTNSSRIGAIEKIVGKLYIYPPLGVIAGNLSIDSYNYSYVDTSSINLTFELQDTNINYLEN